MQPSHIEYLPPPPVYLLLGERAGEAALAGGRGHERVLGQVDGPRRDHRPQGGFVVVLVDLSVHTAGVGHVELSKVQLPMGSEEEGSWEQIFSFSLSWISRDVSGQVSMEAVAIKTMKTQWKYK